MAYCGPRGIPHSVFLGWKPSDQDKALAWQADQAEKCPVCGTSDEDWIDLTTKRLLPNPRYRASHRRCYGCAEIQSKRDQVEQATGNRHDSTSYVSLVVGDA